MPRIFRLLGWAPFNSFLIAQWLEKWPGLRFTHIKAKRAASGAYRPPPRSALDIRLRTHAHHQAEKRGRITAVWRPLFAHPKTRGKPPSPEIAIAQAGLEGDGYQDLISDQKVVQHRLKRGYLPDFPRVLSCRSVMSQTMPCSFASFFDSAWRSGFFGYSISSTGFCISTMAFR